MNNELNETLTKIEKAASTLKDTLPNIMGLVNSYRDGLTPEQKKELDDELGLQGKSIDSVNKDLEDKMKELNELSKKFKL
jgi:hypothetical protein